MGVIKKEQIIVCPHCGNKTPQEFKYVITKAEDLIDTNGEWAGAVDVYTVLTQCKTCKDSSLFGSSEFSDNPENLEEATLLYPQAKKLSDGVPEIIRKNYLEAKRIEKISPTSFVVLVRKALEYMCNDKSAEGKTLKEKLSYLAKKGVMPITLSKMASALRLLGNIGAHASDFEIDSNEVKTIDDFFIAIVEYVYIAPEKIKKFEQSLLKKKTVKKK